MKTIILILFVLFYFSCCGGNGGWGCEDCDDRINEMMEVYGPPDETEIYTVVGTKPKEMWTANYYYFDLGKKFQFIQYECECAEHEYEF